MYSTHHISTFSRWAQRGYYSAIPAAVTLQCKPQEIALYSVLVLFADHYTHECYPSLKTIADTAGMSESTVKKWLTGLKRKNFVKVHRQWTTADGEGFSRVKTSEFCVPAVNLYELVGQRLNREPGAGGYPVGSEPPVGPAETGQGRPGTRPRVGRESDPGWVGNLATKENHKNHNHMNIKPPIPPLADEWVDVVDGQCEPPQAAETDSHTEPWSDPWEINLGVCEPSSSSSDTDGLLDHAGTLRHGENTDTPLDALHDVSEELETPEGYKDTRSEEEPATDVSRPGKTRHDSESTPAVDVEPKRKTARRRKNTTDTPEEFTTFWQAYPRKISKKNALTAWKKAIRRIDADDLVAKTREYAELVAGKDPRYIPHPATWLNGDRWEDNTYLKAEHAARPSTHTPPPPAAGYDTAADTQPRKPQSLLEMLKPDLSGWYGKEWT